MLCAGELHGAYRYKVCKPCAPAIIGTHRRLGRFLQKYSGDDILFGNVFDRRLKLPWGFGAALRFMKCVFLADCCESLSLMSMDTLQVCRPNSGRMPPVAHTPLGFLSLPLHYAPHPSHSPRQGTSRSPTLFPSLYRSYRRRYDKHPFASRSTHRATAHPTAPKTAHGAFQIRVKAQRGCARSQGKHLHSGYPSAAP
jgi:hypothetical protein